MLLNRTTRKIMITELGLSYYQHCFKILDELRSSELFIKEYYQETTGTITLLAPVTFGIQYVVPVLNSFLEKIFTPLSTLISLTKKSISKKVRMTWLSACLKPLPCMNTPSFYVPFNGDYLPRPDIWKHLDRS